MKRTGIVVWMLAGVLASSALGTTAGVSSMETSARTRNRLGSYLAIGEPSPTLIGINLAYNITDFLRASVGYGSLTVTSGISIDGSGTVTTSESKASTFGLGVRGFVPGWSISPTVGLHYGHVSYSGNPGLSVGGFNESGGHVYASLGVDWQAEGGFNAGLGFKQSFRSGIGSGVHLNLGWFVNWLG